MAGRANYGIDAPGVVRNLMGGGLLAGIAAAVLFSKVPGLARALMWSGGTCFVSGALMVFGSKVWKLRPREKILDLLHLKSSHRVLDVGCGRGLMLIGAARRVPSGQAVGIDLWQTQDQSGNHPDVTRANAHVEGVEDRIQIETGDMRKLPFEDSSFDAITSSWAIHNIYDAAGRAEALREIVRVTKAGGRVALVDIRHTDEYANELRRLGMTGVTRSLPSFVFVTPSHIVTAQKPG